MSFDPTSLPSKDAEDAMALVSTIRSVQASLYQALRPTFRSNSGHAGWALVRLAQPDHREHLASLETAAKLSTSQRAACLAAIAKQRAKASRLGEQGKVKVRILDAIANALHARHDADTGVRSAVPEAPSPSPTGLPSPRRWFKEPSAFEPCIDAVQTCRRARGLPELIANEFGDYMVTHDPIDMSIFTAVYKAEVDAGRIVEEKDDGDA